MNNNESSILCAAKNLWAVPQKIIKFITQNIYRKDIVSVILLKLILLFLLWFCFFSTQHHVLKHAQLAEHFISDPMP